MRYSVGEKDPNPTGLTGCNTDSGTVLGTVGVAMRVASPNRITRQYVQTLAGPPEGVFPLLCPVREHDWVNGWDPRIVLTSSGLAEMDCVFVTPGTPEDAVWVITRHDPDEFLLEMLKFIPGMVVAKIVIQLESIPEGSSANISYSYTSLSPQGDAALEGLSQEHFDVFMRTWEQELNHYLLMGEKLPREPSP